MSDLLTQAEVDALEGGTKITVIWSGGNGPHKYTLKHLYPSGQAVAVVEDGTIVGALDSVGINRLDDRVSRSCEWSRPNE